MVQLPHAGEKALDELEQYSNSTSKKIEGYIKSTRWKRRAERVPRKLKRMEQTLKAKPLQRAGA